MEYQRKFILTNYKRLKIMTLPCNRGIQKDAAIIVCHGRISLFDCVKSDVLRKVTIPRNLVACFYTREFGTLTNQEMKKIAANLLTQNTSKPIDKYTMPEEIHNYTIRPDPLFSANLFFPTSRFDIIYPMDVMHIKDVFDAVKCGYINYKELHVLACRGIRLTSAGSF